MLSDNYRGALFMSGCMAAFVINDTLVKIVLAEYELFQTILLRGLITSAMIGLLAWYRRELFVRVEKKDRGIIILRLLSEVGATLTFLTALDHMPLANATAILQALPLAVTLAAAIFLGEKVGWRRYLAIIVGLVGVLIIVRPGTEGFNEFSLLALGTVFFVVIRDICTSRLSRNVPSLFVSFLTAVLITVIGGIFAPTQEWHAVSSDMLLLLAAASCFIIFGYLFSVMCMRVGDISFVSPFRYTVLIWAIALGYFVFGDEPDNWTLIGSGIVAIAGIYTFYREHKSQKPEIVAAEQSERPEVEYSDAIAEKAQKTDR